MQIVVASIYSIMIATQHPWGVTFKPELQTTSCFLAGKDLNMKTYCNHVALSQCRDSKLSPCLNMLVVYVCLRECSVCERVVHVCMCVCICVCAIVCLVCTKVVTRILHILNYFSLFFLSKDSYVGSYIFLFSR